MVETSFNLFDLAVLAVLGLSALVSFFRGFIREFLSLGAWVGASIITLYAFPGAAKLLEPALKSAVIASGLAAMGIFMGSLVAISIFNSLLMKLFKRGKDVGMLDNALGLAFGLVRACALLSLGYFIFTLVMSEKDFPEWLATSKTRPAVEAGAVLLAKLAPDYLDNISPLGQTQTESGPGASLAEKIGAAAQEIVDKKAQSDAKKAESGETAAGDDYDWMNVEELERLIENAPSAEGNAPDAQTTDVEEAPDAQE